MPTICIQGLQEVNGILYSELQGFIRSTCVWRLQKLSPCDSDILRNINRTLRAESYQTVRDAIDAGDHQTETLGTRVILPPSFLGSPRDMQRRYQDAMAIVRKFGKPHLFVTMTCNPQWPEITNSLLPAQSPQDRPDLVARVFKAYLMGLLEDVLKRGVLGKVRAHLYVIEFQKRGLPHAHILLILEHGPQTSTDVDKFVSAELPHDLALREIVGKQMVHGPCGRQNPRAPCMREGVCSKHYPKNFAPQSSWDESTTHPTYRRREPRDGGITCTVRDRVIDNRWVVPYNPFLLAKYRCHINVEVCSSVRACKYLFKYVYKGPDRAMVGVSRGHHTDANNVRDEVKEYQDLRTIGSSEACWRLYAFDMSDRAPAVVPLPIHQENGQRIYFATTAEAVMTSDQPPKTTLTSWFEYNRENVGNPNALHLYSDMPQHCTFNKATKTWNPKRRLNGTIGRIHWVHPSAGDLFYLRMLLHHPHSKGKVNFDDLRTVESTTYVSYKAVCRALGLLQDDTEWSGALDDAAHTMMCSQMRQLFVALLEFNSPSDPSLLLDKYALSMADDYSNMLDRTGVPGNVDRETLLRGMVVIDIGKRLERRGRSLSDYGIQDTTTEIRVTAQEVNSSFISSELPAVLREELCYDKEEQAAIADDSLQKMLPSQRAVVDPALQSILDGRQFLAFWDAPAGTGKTFCTNALLAALRSRGFCALAVATSGIASILMAGGRTFHSRFKAPLQINAQTVFPIKHREALAELIRRAAVICWDEAPMGHRFLMEALDRTFRDITKVDRPFGGKSVILDGDFRQVLPVLKHGTRAQIVNACLKKSPLWALLTVYHLTENMQVRRGGYSEAAENYAKWLLQLGDGKLESEAGMLMTISYLFQIICVWTCRISKR